MKTAKILLGIAGILLFVSCSEEFDFLSREDHTHYGGPVFRASVDDSWQTRTQLESNDAAAVLWSPGDAIVVFDGGNVPYKFISSAEEATVSTDFHCEDNTATLIEPYPGEYYYSLYPYDSQATIEEGIIHTSYPSSFQITRYGSFLDNMNLAVARSESYTLKFDNLSGWIKLGFTGDEGITKIVFKGNNGEKLAGNVSIDVENVAASVEDEGSSTELVLTGSFVSSASREEGCFYYIPVLSLSFTKGLTLVFYKDDGTTYTFSVSSNLTFKKGKRRELWVDFSTLQKQYTYTRVKTSAGATAPTFQGGDEYIVAFPAGEGSYKVFSPDKLMTNIENFKSYDLSDFATNSDYRNGMAGTRIFNNDYITVSGNEDFITVDTGIGVVVDSKTVTLGNETASFPNSHARKTGIEMTITDIGIKQWDNNTNSSLAGGTLDADDMYVLCDQILSRHSTYFNDWRWYLAMGSSDDDIKRLVANQYNGDYSITAGYIIGSYNGTSYEGFAFKDKFLFQPAIALKKVHIYRRTPSSN